MLFRSRELIREKVAILIPARNEERNIKECLETIENQKHLDQFSIFVLDDSSTDNTHKLIRERVNANSKMVLLRGGELPEGWTGKNNACWQLAHAAENFDYLVFVDADVRLREDAVAKSINALKKFRWQYVCPYPRQLAKSWSEWLIQPQIGRAHV